MSKLTRREYRSIAKRPGVKGYGFSPKGRPKVIDDSATLRTSEVDPLAEGFGFDTQGEFEHDLEETKQKIADCKTSDPVVEDNGLEDDYDPSKDPNIIQGQIVTDWKRDGATPTGDRNPKFEDDALPGLRATVDIDRPVIMVPGTEQTQDNPLGEPLVVKEYDTLQKAPVSLEEARETVTVETDAAATAEASDEDVGIRDPIEIADDLASALTDQAEEDLTDLAEQEREMEDDNAEGEDVPQPGAIGEETSPAGYGSIDR